MSAKGQRPPTSPITFYGRMNSVDARRFDDTQFHVPGQASY